jgi:hypothetical protein
MHTAVGQFCERAKFQFIRFFSAAVQQLPFLLLNSYSLVLASNQLSKNFELDPHQFY